jgi:hypothetical protein
MQEGVGKYYTKYPNIFGVGSSGPRMGDAVWPEENFSLVLWCEEEEARGVARAVAAVKTQFPDEGIRIFGLPEQTDRVSQGPYYAGTFADEPGTKYTVLQGPRPPAEPLEPVPPAASSTALPPASPTVPAARAPVPAAPIYTPPPVYTPPPPYMPPPVYQPASGINKEYDGQNMDEEH